MTDLIQRIEAAKEPSVELFEEAFAKLRPCPEAPATGYIGNDGYFDIPEYKIWSPLYDRFTAMLDAQAWTSAAEMLVPDGWEWLRLSSNSATVYQPPENDKDWADHISGKSAAHPSLALLSAILRAERKDDE